MARKRALRVQPRRSCEERSPFPPHAPLLLASCLQALAAFYFYSSPRQGFRVSTALLTAVLFPLPGQANLRGFKPCIIGAGSITHAAIDFSLGIGSKLGLGIGLTFTVKAKQAAETPSTGHGQEANRIGVSQDRWR